MCLSVYPALKDIQQLAAMMMVMVTVTTSQAIVQRMIVTVSLIDRSDLHRSLHTCAAMEAPDRSVMSRLVMT